MSSMARRFVKKMEKTVDFDEVLERMFGGKAPPAIYEGRCIERNGKKIDIEEVIIPFEDKTTYEAFDLFIAEKNKLNESSDVTFNVLLSDGIVLITCKREEKEEVEEYVKELLEREGEGDEEI